jgi:hypothetical protein
MEKIQGTCKTGFFMRAITRFSDNCLVGARSFFYLVAVSHFSAMGKSFVLMRIHSCKAGAGL